MTRLTVDGVAYEVRAAGAGTRTLLFLHGFTGRGADWHAIAPGVRTTGHRTVVVDLLGHGRSDAPGDPAAHAIERQAAALATILRRLDAVPAIVVGYSMGSRIGLRLAIDHPALVAGLVLESPSAGIADPDERAARLAADHALADRLEREGLEAFLRFWEAQPLFAGEHRLPRVRRDRLYRERARNTVPGLAASLRGAGQGAMQPLHDAIRTLRDPTLVVAGGRDPTGAARARVVADAIPTADLVTLPHLGHAPHREAPAAFRRLLTDRLTAWRTAAA